MEEQLQKLLSEVEQKMSLISRLDELQTYRFDIIDRKDSQFASVASGIKDIPKELRKDAGIRLNEVRETILDLFNKRLTALEEVRYSNLEKEEWIDLTVPSNLAIGHKHPVTQAYFEIVDIFKGLGFHFASGPEIEWFYYAFEALNMPITHPAGDEFETYYMSVDPHKDKGRALLRPHTSPVQVRTMENSKPPIRVVVPGKTYRPQYDVSHTPMFHQFEGLLVDKDVSIGDLVGTLQYFVKRFFGEEAKVRIRPYHFRFTEPSFEVDISCTICHGEGCRLCKEGWLELGGAGMVHPNVLQYGGIDPSEFNGFAFGWGIERCVNIRSGIPDIRMLYEGELRLLEQF